MTNEQIKSYFCNADDLWKVLYKFEADIKQKQDKYLEDSENDDYKNSNKAFLNINSNYRQMIFVKLNYIFRMQMPLNDDEAETFYNNEENFEFIKERLLKVKINENQSHQLSFELLYKAKKHGDHAKDFHLRCDKYRNTLTIIKTKEGLIFGGFTSETWEGNDFDKEDENAFCFSLDKHKIYNSIKGKKAIFASPTEGPCFQNCIFEVKDKCFENGGICDADVKSHFDNIESDYEINGGNNNFLVENLEVFAVYFG